MTGPLALYVFSTVTGYNKDRSPTRSREGHFMDAYLAYLIRLWRVETEAGPVWRAALEDPYSAERHSFADLSGLVAFLMEKTEAVIEIDL
jgi:hypothetical protein